MFPVRATKAGVSGVEHSGGAANELSPVVWFPIRLYSSLRRQRMLLVSWDCGDVRHMALPTIRGCAATAAIEAFALHHPHLAHHIRELGVALLRRGTGLRNGRNGASNTYDLSFVNCRHAFASLTATPKKYNAATEGRLQVSVRYQGEVDLQVFELKSMRSERLRGWHGTQLAGSDGIAPLLDDLRIALAD